MNKMEKPRRKLGTGYTERTRTKKEEMLQKLTRNIRRHRQDICDHCDYQGFPTIQYHRSDLTDNEMITMGRCTECEMIIPIYRLPKKYEAQIEELHPGFDHIPYRRLDGTFTCVICNYPLDDEYMTYFKNKVRMMPFITDMARINRFLDDLKRVLNIKPDPLYFDIDESKKYRKIRQINRMVDNLKLEMCLNQMACTHRKSDGKVHLKREKSGFLCSCCSLPVTDPDFVRKYEYVKTLGAHPGKEHTPEYRDGRLYCSECGEDLEDFRIMFVNKKSYKDTYPVKKEIETRLCIESKFDQVRFERMVNRTYDPVKMRSKWSIPE